MQNYQIAPSILSANLACLGEEVTDVLSAGADMIHFDVMDNHYVPNLTFGPIICQALRDYGITAPIDVHLMVKPVDTMIQAFANAGADAISIHPESTEHLHRSLQLIKDLGCKAGVALNPATPITHLQHIIKHIDNVLIMSVNPGFGGQSFIPEMLDKITELRQFANKYNPSIRIAVDGGVNVGNIEQIARAGADTFIAGSAIFNTSHYSETIEEMRKSLARVK